MTNLAARMRPLAIDRTPDSSEAVVDEPMRTTMQQAVSLEREIAEALDAPPFPGEQLAPAFARKERALATLFARLTVIEARGLHRRLTLLSADDVLVQLFQRLIPERRSRLLAFLAGARRREAVKHAKSIGGRCG
jgi:hypothetical protein